MIYSLLGADGKNIIYIMRRKEKMENKETKRLLFFSGILLLVLGLVNMISALYELWKLKK